VEILKDGYLVSSTKKRRVEKNIYKCKKILETWTTTMSEPLLGPEKILFF
jgi:hypothetical protein